MANKLKSTPVIAEKEVSVPKTKPSERKTIEKPKAAAPEYKPEKNNPEKLKKDRQLREQQIYP